MVNNSGKLLIPGAESHPLSCYDATMCCVPLRRVVGCLVIFVSLSVSAAWAAPETLERTKTSYPVVHVGLDYLFSQDTDGGLFDNEARTLGFKVGVYRHAGSFDLGLLVGHQGMGTFAASSGQRFFASGQVFANFDVRWRYRKRPWGDFVLNLGVGFAGFFQTDEAVAQSQQDDFDGEGIPKFGTGVNIQFSLGVLIFMTKNLASHFKLGVTSAFSTQDEDDDRSRSLHVMSFLLGYGIEFIP